MGVVGLVVGGWVGGRWWVVIILKTFENKSSIKKREKTRRKEQNHPGGGESTRIFVPSNKHENLQTSNIHFHDLYDLIFYFTHRQRIFSTSKNHVHASVSAFSPSSENGISMIEYGARRH